ncbi:MAG: general secretion pathway protein GspB [Gammaproteobacteria bacterium]|nr:general secretion pathway protein GspB [Gammaproteobacteria bacterium]
MSFILDALKKSETERQRQSSAEFAGVPTSRDNRRVPRWLWVLGLLLAINLVVLLGLLFRPGARPPVLPETTVTETRAAAVDAPDFAAQIAAAKQNVPVHQDAVSAEPKTLPSVAPAATPGVVYSDAPRNSTSLPTVHEVIANGTVMVPDLHLDIHVYSDIPEDRFVFINMSKQRENSQLTEGPVVKEILPEGVILEYQGTSFLLTRD